MKTKILLAFFLCILVVSTEARTICEGWSKDGESKYIVKTSECPRIYYWYLGSNRSKALIIDNNKILDLTEDEKYYKSIEYMNDQGDLVIEKRDSKSYLSEDTIGYEMFIKTIKDYKYNIITVAELPIKAIDTDYLIKKDIFIREKPSYNSKRKRLIPKGERINAYQATRNWVLTNNLGNLGDEGWIPKNAIEKPQELSAPLKQYNVIPDVINSQEGIISPEGIMSPESIISPEINVSIEGIASPEAH